MTASSEASAAQPRRLGSYTTAKVTQGRIERLEQHVARLRRDAGRLGLALPVAAEVERAAIACARETFGGGDGIVRIEWSHLPDQAPAMQLIPRAFAPLRTAWRAITAEIPHPGPEARRNTKHTDVPAWDAARAAVAAGEIEEALLFDAAGHLVEGSRANLVVVDRAGAILTPARALGGVEGLGLSVLRHGHPEIREATLDREAVRTAQALLAVNAVRGVVPIERLDGEAVGTEAGATVARRLAAVFGAR